METGLFNIRKAALKDLDACRHICIETAMWSDISKESVRRYLTKSFCDPYIEHFIDSCFIAEDTEGVFGYIICAPDYGRYSKVVDKYYSAGAKKSFFQRLKKLLSLSSEKKRVERYPAHLHINILPRGQKRGVGKALMKALFSELQGLNVEGIHLGVDGRNKNAMSFYEHLGFKRTDKAAWGYYYAMDGGGMRALLK